MDAICSLYLSPFIPAPGLSVVTTRDWGGTEVLIDPPEYRWAGAKMLPDELPPSVLDKLTWLTHAAGVCLSIPHEWLYEFQCSVSNRLEEGHRSELATFLRTHCRSETTWVLAFLAHAEDYDGFFGEPIDEAIARLARSVSFDSEMVGFISYSRAPIGDGAAHGAPSG